MRKAEYQARTGERFPDEVLVYWCNCLLLDPPQPKPPPHKLFVAGGEGTLVRAYLRHYPGEGAHARNCESLEHARAKRLIAMHLNMGYTFTVLRHCVCAAATVRIELRCEEGEHAAEEVALGIYRLDVAIIARDGRPRYGIEIVHSHDTVEEGAVAARNALGWVELDAAWVNGALMDPNEKDYREPAPDRVFDDVAERPIDGGHFCVPGAACYALENWELVPRSPGLIEAFQRKKRCPRCREPVRKRQGMHLDCKSALTKALRVARANEFLDSIGKAEGSPWFFGESSTRQAMAQTYYLFDAMKLELATGRLTWRNCVWNVKTGVNHSPDNAEALWEAQKLHEAELRRRAEAEAEAKRLRDIDAAEAQRLRNIAAEKARAGRDAADAKRRKDYEEALAALKTIKEEQDEAERVQAEDAKARRIANALAAQEAAEAARLERRRADAQREIDRYRPRELHARTVILPLVTDWANAMFPGKVHAVTPTTVALEGQEYWTGTFSIMVNNRCAHGCTMHIEVDMSPRLETTFVCDQATGKCLVHAGRTTWALAPLCNPDTRTAALEAMVSKERGRR